MDQKKGNRPPDPQSLRDALRHSPLGRWLDERETGLVLGTGRLAEMRAGDVLFREGDEIRHVPFVLSGEVKLVKMGPQGREYVLHLTRGGTFPDPGALFYEAPLPATAVALGPGRLLWLERATMDRLLDGNPRLARWLLQVLAARQRLFVNKVAGSQGVISVSRRVAGWLLHRSRMEEGRRQLELPGTRELMARLLGYDKKDIYDLAVTMEMLHAATLLHDDVLDNADTRRGKPAAHTIFNATSTILAGDAMLAHANALVAQCGDPRLCLCFSEATSRTAAGEILEIAAQHQVETTAEEYEEIIRGKTAWLIRASCQLGALRAGADDALVEAAAAYGENIGMAFQIVDDALDFAPQSVTGKPSGGDVREGKLTPPLRMYRDSLDDAARAAFDQAFNDASFTDSDAERIADGIRAAGFDQATRMAAEGYLDKARAALATLPSGPEQDILQQMADYVRDRKK